MTYIAVFVLGGLAATIGLTGAPPNVRERIFNYFDLRKR